MQMTIPETLSSKIREMAAACGLLAIDFEDFILRSIPKNFTEYVTYDPVDWDAEDDRQERMKRAVQQVFDHAFKYIDIDTLLDLPCMLTPIVPDSVVGLRTIRQWIDAYRIAAPNNRTPAYRDMKLYLESFDRSRVKFLTNADMNFTLWNNSKIDQRLLLDRHKWIIASLILYKDHREEWQPIPQIPDVFL